MCRRHWPRTPKPTATVWAYPNAAGRERRAETANGSTLRSGSMPETLTVWPRCGTFWAPGTSTSIPGAEEIENVKMLDRSTTLVFGLICLSAGVGFLASTASNLVAAIRRKRRVLGIIRLMGFSGADIVCFPLMQTLFTSALGMGLAFAPLRRRRGRHQRPLPPRCGTRRRLPPVVGACRGAAGVVLALSLLAALPPSLSCSRLSPSEVIRNE